MLYSFHFLQISNLVLQVGCIPRATRPPIGSLVFVRLILLGWLPERLAYFTIPVTDDSAAILVKTRNL